MAVAVLAGGADASAPWCVSGRLAAGPGAEGSNCLGLLSARTPGVYTPGTGGMNSSDLQEMLLEAHWVKSKASPATNHQCKKVACISAAPSFMCY